MLRQKRENTVTTGTEQTHFEKKNDDQIEKQENQLPETTDFDREIPKTGRESNKDREKHVRKFNVFKALKIRKKQGEKSERTEECKTKEAESGEENVERNKDIVTDQQSSKELPKNSEDERNPEKERLHQHYKEMEECRLKMEEAMRRYKETADMYAAELKKIEARNA
ncbi:GTPase IMAP family member 8-like protein [Labeo rohita]|uniref:GTPase IMAP family member 8-like protein n=1 Tax=Labeo rohita TaxID=84645 RepID=A0A498LGT4_LABRO|nr:GTPase IMAP family member 8-like protein [Labeo rohita]